jgi:hypothetical protein
VDEVPSSRASFRFSGLILPPVPRRRNSVPIGNEMDG